MAPAEAGTRTHLPSVVSWNVTAACPLRCPHCYLDAGRRRPEELSPEEAMRLVDQLAEAGTRLLILTGGEPLLRADLPALARRATERGISVVLGTTGTLIDGPTARLLKKSGVLAVGISLDSVDPAKHDGFRGRAGAWQQAMGGLQACRAAGLEVQIHTTALRMNREEIPALIRFAYQEGARSFHLFFLVCTGRGEELTDLSPQEYEDMLLLVLDAHDRYPGMMVRARCAPYLRRLAGERGSPLLGSAGCLAGTSYCRITPSGDVTPCPYLPLAAGNVGSERFGTIWESSPVLGQLRSPQRQLSGKCGLCPLSQGEEPLCVGCRARAWALRGDALAEDPWCLYEPGQESHWPPAPAAGAAYGQDTTPATVMWTEEALQRLSRIPPFVRGWVKQAAEAYAQQQSLPQVTPGVLERLRQRAPREGFGPNPAPRRS